MQKQRVNYSVITIVTLLIVFFTFVNNQPQVAAQSKVAQPMVGTDTPTPTPTDTVYNNSGITATQSATLVDLVASRAIDGDFTNFTATPGGANNNWLQLDLGYTRDVTNVTIYNRTDCCPERLNGALAFVSNIDLGDSRDITYNKTQSLAWRNVLCNNQASCTTSAVSTGYTVTFPAGTRARYLRIQLENTMTLSIAEIVISGIYQTNTPTPTPTDTVYNSGMTATQSSTLLSWGASLAIDGNFTNYTHTNGENNSWLQLDLGYTRDVTKVTIYNRTDCCPERLNGAVAFLSNSSLGDSRDITYNKAQSLAWRNVLCNNQASCTTSAVSTGYTVTFPAGTRARYLRIQLENTMTLSIAEIVISGIYQTNTPTPLSTTYTALANQTNTATKATQIAASWTKTPTPTDTVYNSGITASQSSTYGNNFNYNASAAIDGNYGNFTHTNPDDRSWLQLDLGYTRDVTKVIVYNRRDCCHTPFSGAVAFLSNIDLGDSRDMNYNKAQSVAWKNVICDNQTTCTTAPLGIGYTVTFPAGTRARYLRIQLDVSGQALTIAEIVVSGIFQTNTPTPTPNQTGTAMVNQTSTAIANQTGTAIANQTGTAIANQTGTAITNQTGTAIVNQTNTAIVNQTGTAIANQTGTAIANQTGTATRLTQIAASWSPTPTNTNTRTIVVPTQPLTANTTSGQVIAWGNNAPYKLNAIPSQANSAIAQIAMGAHHALAVTSDGKLLGWGTNVKGELTIPAPAQTGILQSAVGLNHSVVLKQDGTVVMWGSSAALTAPSGGALTGITQIATGDNHTVMLRNNGTIQVYGASNQRTTIPTVIASKYIVGIAAGSDSSFALDSTGAVYAWGKSINIPILAAGSITRIFAAGNVYGALRSDGRLILFGSGVTNLVATGTASTLTNSTSGCPCMIIPSMDGVRNVSATQWGVIITRRSLQTQAYAYSGQSVLSALPTGILQLSTNPNHAIGIAIMPVYSATNTATTTPILSLGLRSIEYNSPGYLSIWGGDSTINSSIPAAAQGQLLQVVAGYRHISVLGTDGVVTSWGDNRYGQSTVPSELTSARPLTDTMRVIALASGANHNLALRRNGSVLAWGDNSAGQSNVPSNLLNVVSGPATATNTATNTATTTNTSTATNTRTSTRTATRTSTRTTTRTSTRTTTPTPVIKSFAIQLAAGVSHSVALLNDGSVQSWGDNTYGQLNQPFLSSIVKIAAGGWHTVALRRDNIVFAWGRNNAGQTDVVRYRNVIDIAASAENTMLLLSSGRIIVIGQNDYEQRTIPAGLFQQIGVGKIHMLAITDNKQVVSWGMNSNGQDQVPTNLWHPFQVTGGNTFSAALSQLILEPQPTTAAGAPTAPVLPAVPPMVSPPVHDHIIFMSGETSDTYNGSSIAFAANTTAYVKNADTLTLDSLCSALPNTDFTTQIHHVALGTYGMALRLDRTVRAWAPCSTNGTPATDITDTIPAAFQRYVAEIAVRGTHMMVLTLDGRVWSNQFNLTQYPNIKHIAAGRDFAVVLLADGSVKVIANNNNDGVATIPARAATLIEIEAGDYHILGLRADGQLVTWGANSNDYGQADLPYSATLGNVIAISAGERQSMALMKDGNAVAWGDYTAATLDALYEANLAHHITNIFTGDRNIAVFFEDDVPTVTIVPTNTAVPMPTMTARANTAEFVTNQVAWYTMSDFSAPQVFAANVAASTFQCAIRCPVQAIPDGSNDSNARYPALLFNDANGDELVASTNTTLNGVPFTARASLRRTNINRADVLLSIGTAGSVRQYLTMGIDKENRPYCSFYGDDLRSTSWYVDRQWHDYACSFDPVSRTRTLWRDAQIIGQDIVRGAFTPPAAPLIIGRRYDTMEGVNGELSQVAIFNRVLTRAELNGTTPLNESDKLNGLIIETQLQSISPNGGTMRCGASNNKCPLFGRPEANSLVPHDSSAAIFSNNSAQQLTLTAPASTSGFTVAFWANVSAVSASGNDFFMTKTNATGQGMSVGLRADSTGYMPLCAGYTATAPVIVESENAVFNRWYHFACSYNPTTQKLSFYVNAKLYSEATIVLPAISDPLMLGYSSSASVWPKSGFTGALDNVMLYNSPVSANTVIQIYNNTNPASLVPTLTATACATPGSCPTLTATTTFTRTPTGTMSPTNVRSKTPLAATGTATIPGFVPSNTRTRSTTPTVTRTLTVTRTPTISGTATVTATLPSATPFIANTFTATRTRTHLRITQTMLARRSPTFYAQTQTARAVTSTPSRTATATRTATAYPLPPTNTPVATAYPTP